MNAAGGRNLRPNRGGKNKPPRYSNQLQNNNQQSGMAQNSSQHSQVSCVYVCVFFFSCVCVCVLGAGQIDENGFLFAVKFASIITIFWHEIPILVKYCFIPSFTETKTMVN